MKQNKETLWKQHLNRLKLEKRVVLFWQLLIFVTFFIFWEVASRMYWIDPLLFSSPSSIYEMLSRRLAGGSMLVHIRVTLFETILGFVIGTIAGILIASALWASKRLSNVLDPYLVILNAMPKVALGPIIIVAFGPGYFSIIAMGAMVSVIITALVVYTGFREADPNYERVLRSFGATRFQVFKEAVFPSTLPAIISTFKVNVGLAWVGVIVGEFLVSKQGLGYLIIYGFQVFDFTLVMSSLILIAIFAALMFKLVEKIEKWLIRHTS
ncbi:ABC transporter permease [Aciduricibacillus chroicocephali]|uniref:ABC transporter permease n=1 Tax=Aciduricibacillus chroicocephali TaxID=3054939 RepID=A0ABY9KT24_9BACI|nr:ABC transporter permease [Bacillaceae bacterium 44XB]